MSQWRKLKFLLRKNFLIRSRQKVYIILEIVWPLTLFTILMWVRTRNFSEPYQECHYLAKALPSAGFLPFIQSYLCTFARSNCQKSPKVDDDIGTVNSEHSLLNTLAKNVQIFLGNRTTITEIEELMNDVSEIVSKTSNLELIQVSNADLILRDLARNETEFINLLKSSGLSNDSAYNLYFSKIKPVIFLEVAQILTQSGITVQGLGNPSFEDLMKLLEAETAIRNRFCQISNLERLMNVFDKNATQKLSIEMCDMDFTVFMPKINKMFDRNILTLALDKVLKNLTGYDMTIDQLMNISGIVQRISANMSPESNIGSLIGNFGKIGGQDVGDYFRRFVCGAGENETDDSLFLSKSNIERMRERFQGQRHHTAELPGLRETNVSSSTMFATGIGPSKVYVDPSHRAQSEADHFLKTPRKNQDEEDEAENQAKKPKKLFTFMPKKKRKRIFPKDSNNTRLVCNTILLDVLEETQCWDWLKSFEIPQSFLFQLFSILRGFILISPNIDPVERVSRKLGDWMDNLRMLQKMLIDLDLNAESYQRVLHDSDLGRSVRILHKIVHKLNNATHMFDNSTISRLDTIVSFFLNASDPLAGLPVLKSNLQTIIDLLACFRTSRILLMENERMTEELATCLMDFNQFFGAVTFQEGKIKSALPKLTIYKIRLANYLTDTTTRILDKTWNPRPRDRPFMDLKYLYYGFSFLQDSVDKAIIEEQTNTTIPTGVYAQQFPNPCYSIDQFVKATARLLPLCMTLAWVLTFSLIIKNVVYEKELRLKEFMKVMGLGNFLHWAAWYIQTIVVVLISIILFVTILKFGRIVQKADFTILTVFILLYANASISQAFLISTLFNNANLAANCGGFIYFVLFLPYSISFPFMDTLKFGHKMAMNLLAQVAFGHGCMYMAIWEDEGEGLQWWNLHLSPDMNDNYNFLTPMLMLIFDAWLYAILTWYIENVFPGAYGIPRPWYFFLQTSYWCGESHNDLVYAVEDNEYFYDEDNQFIEPPARNAHVGVSVQNLTKRYSNGKVAVDGLSVNFYENQITSFLGHNGAGKTTTISILTGLYPPTSGTVIVRGMDVRTRISQIRKSLGMCPQYNVLFDTLTVEEQLVFYGGLKGLTDQEIRNEVEKMLVTLNLIPKRNVLSKFLSGGMKRKLSIAVAFLGDSKIVVLDEPTAGVDPFARRQIWDLMVQCKAGRTIIMSTHHMDEADLLGDRIAIIASGKLKCCGSSLFLKNLYGSGYYLTMVLDPSFRTSKARSSAININQLENNGNNKRRVNSLTETTPSCSSSEGTGMTLDEIDARVPSTSKKNTKLKRSFSLTDLTENKMLESNDFTLGKDLQRTIRLLKQFITSYVPGANFVERIGQELIFSLPRDQPRRLAHLFAQLDRCQASLDESRKLGIVSYGVSETKLEEIFLKVDPIGDDTGKKSPAFYKKCFKFFGRISENCKRPKRASQTSTPPAEDATSAPKRKDEEELHCNTPLVKGKTKAPKRALPSNGGPKIVGITLEEETLEKRKWWLLRRQIYALYVKRYLNFKRNLKGAFCEIILPVLVIAFTMVGLSLQPKDVPEQPPLRLSPWLYGPPNYMFYSLNNSNATADRILNTMVYPPGPGYRCMDQNPFQDLECTHVSPFDRYSGAKTYSDVHIDNSKCVCSNESNYKCPFSAYIPQPPTKLSDTTDHLVNLTMLNITQWLLMTEKLYRKQRYGGFSLGEINSVANENIDYRLVEENLNILSALLANFSTIVRLDWKNVTRISPETDILPVNESSSTLPVEWFKMNFTRQLTLLLDGMEVKRNVKVWFNNQGWAALPSYVNVLSNAMLRSNLPQEKWADYGIVVYNHPMNYSSNQQGQRIAYGFNIGAELTAAVMIILAFSVIPASFVLFLIDERSSDAKHLHLVSGVAPNIYWIANFAWDLTNFFIPVIGVMFVFFIFDQVAYIGWFRNAFAAFLLLYIYGYATIPIMYLFTFLFRVPSVAFIWLATGNLFFGWVTTTVTSMLEILGQDDAFLIKINNYLMMVFLVIPQYSLGRGMLDMKLQYFLYKGEEFAFGHANPADPFAWKFLGRNMLSLFIEGTLAFILVLLIENYKWKAQRTEMSHEEDASPRSEEDDDVRHERNFVMGPKSTDSAIRIVNLTKEYQTSNIVKRIICCTCCKKAGGKNSSCFRAVDRLCFTVQKGECFGLLGVNGAGKTSTFNMLTGKIRVSSGDAFISQKSVLSDRDTVRKNIGFCPQFDALNPLLTAREQLILYARLRGIEEKYIENIVNSLITKLNLSAYSDRISKTYSGGNKRKLSTAMALLGDPSVVLFDEPTTGMDPKARRFLWNKINEITRDGRSVILTSHSMEECEALCSRLGIMVNGRFRCMGSVQHLKNKYGGGYTLTVKLSNDHRMLEEMNRALLNRFPTAILKEQHYCQQKFRFPNRGVKLSAIFGFLLEIQQKFHIEDYSLSQTTLDEVFVSFAAGQQKN